MSYGKTNIFGEPISSEAGAVTWKPCEESFDSFARRTADLCNAGKLRAARPDGGMSKPSNPKDAMGIKKVPMSCVSAPVIAEIGLGMMEGAMKYGRHNYRVIGVRASVYYDAVMRHMMAYWEGEDIDPDSGLPHVSKAMASLAVLRDAQIQGNCTDDRPPRATGQWMQELNAKAAALVDKYPEPVAPFTQVDQSWADAADGPGFSPVTDKQRRRMAELNTWRLGDPVRARTWPEVPEEAVGLPCDVERHE